MSAEPTTAQTDSPAVDQSAPNDKPTSDSAAPASKSSPVKTTARPGKARASMPAGGSSKKNGSSAAEGGKTFKLGDIVLARLKGYPPWPARIADPDNVPRAVLAQRPGKNPSIYCCHFFPVGDYAWLNSREIQPLSSSDIKSYLAQGHRKPTPGAKGLYEAYQTASDPTEWDEGQAQFRADREAAEAEENEGVDELEDDDEDGDAPAGKKRKAPASKGGKKKAAKVEKPSKSDAPASKKAAAKPKPAAKSAKPSDSKPAAPENQAPADDDPLSNDPECVKVKDWRHKLQRAFLGKGLPGQDEMGTYDDMFKSIEQYNDMTIEALTYSKIGKVMKKIAVMDNIPRNDELKITERAQKLMNDWQSIIESKSGKENGANGDHAEEKKEAPAESTEEKTEANGEATTA